MDDYYLSTNLHRSKNSKSAEYVKTGFSRDGLTSSLPKLPPRALSAANFSESPQKRAQSHQSTRTPMKGDVSFESSGRKQAWSSSKGDASAAKNPLHVNHKDIGVDLGSTEPVSVPDEATINVGLMRVADNLARKVLPWQAVLCPRAVETLHDLRQITIQNKHNAFIDQMKAKLEEKVMAFIKKKDEEVEIWIEKEVKSWQQVMKKDEVDLIDFIKRDLERISDRAAMQDKAYRARELTMATAIDDHERDSTREQLVNFRRIVRSNKELGGENNSVAVELRALQDSMAKAQKLTHQQMKKNSRDIIK